MTSRLASDGFVEPAARHSGPEPNHTLFLLFRIGHDRYALDVRQVAEVLPLLTMKQLPRSPPGVAGVINYRGTPIPALDLCDLALGRPAKPQLSTRIVIVNHAVGAAQTYLLGLIAEEATELIRQDPNDFVHSGITNAAAPYLGPVAADPHGVIQRIEVDGLLPPSIRSSLFEQIAAG